MGEEKIIVTATARVKIQIEADGDLNLDDLREKIKDLADTDSCKFMGIIGIKIRDSRDASSPKKMTVEREE